LRASHASGLELLPGAAWRERLSQIEQGWLDALLHAGNKFVETMQHGRVRHAYVRSLSARPEIGKIKLRT
jgi:hypothetical protein